jgi:hypothetical protein
LPRNNAGFKPDYFGEALMNNFKIGTRLGIGFALVLLLLVAMTVVGLLR